MTSSALPTGATYTDNLDGTGTFDWTPDFTQAGVFNVTFFASDGIETDSEQVVITVTDVNQAPVGSVDDVIVGVVPSASDAAAIKFRFTFSSTD